MIIYCTICGVNPARQQSATCSRSCATKASWANADERRQANRDRWTTNNPGPGRPKGSRNKNPYPLTTEQVRERNRNAAPGMSWLGREHTAATRQQMSETRINKMSTGEIPLRCYVKGRFKAYNPSKYKGDPSEIIYRSSWELMVMRYLDKDPSILEWSSEETRIRYKSPIDGRAHTYYPDFFVRKADGCYILEVKPHKETIPPKVQTKATKSYVNAVKTYGVNMAKFEAATNWCKDRGYRFQVLTEHDLGLYKGRGRRST